MTSSATLGFRLRTGAAASLLAVVAVASLVALFIAWPLADGASAPARPSGSPAAAATAPEAVPLPAPRPATAPATSEVVAAPTFAEASGLFRAGRHAAAYGRFVAMANEGDMHAARVALLMHRFGPTLFGSDWDATTEELAEWSRLAQGAEQADIDARLRIGRSR